MENEKQNTAYAPPYPPTNMAAFPPPPIQQGPAPPYGAYPPTDGNNYPTGYAYPPQVGYPQPAYPQPAYPQPAMPPPPSYSSAVQHGNQYVPKSDPYSDTTSPSAYAGAVDYQGVISFSDKSVRLGFIRKVYAILMLQLVFTVGVICLFMFVEPVKQLGVRFDVYISAYVIFIVLYFALACCDSVSRSYPCNIICLTLFTMSMSYMLGCITCYHDTPTVLILMGVTACVCFSVMLFSCQTKYDFTKWGGILFCCAIALFFFGMFTPLFVVLKYTAGKIVLGGALALLFVAFLAYDTQLVMGGKKYELSSEEYVFGALILYMDVIRIFLLLLALFGKK